MSSPLPELAKKFMKNQKSLDYDWFDEWGTMKNTI